MSHTEGGPCVWLEAATTLRRMAEDALPVAICRWAAGDQRPLRRAEAGGHACMA